MILDILDNAHHYLSLNEGFGKAMEFLTRPDLNELPIGKYEIDGDRIFALVYSRNKGRCKEDAQLETHGKYIDIHLILAGTDEIGWKPKSLCRKPACPYNQKSDIQFFEDEPDTWISTKSGSFAIFFLEDAHMPQISSGQLRKAVVKVAVASAT